MSIDYTSSIVAAANRYGIDPSLALAVAQTESSMNPSAVSGSGAIGLFQLMPSTAAGLGVNPNDPLQNIDGGVKYLSQLLGQYNGDTTLALAAYNAGPGNVNKYGGVPPFVETQNYVAKILAMLGVSSATSGGDIVSSDDSTDTDLLSDPSSGLDTTTLAIAGLVGVGIIALIR